MNKSSPVLPIAVLLVVVGVAVWRTSTEESRLPGHAVVVTDISGSVAGRCPSLLGLMKDAMERPAMGPGSTLAVFATGSEKTANEPTLVAEYELPRATRVMEGRDAGAERRRVILHDAAEKCAALPTTTSTPLVIAVTRALQHLAGKGVGRENAIAGDGLKEASRTRGVILVHTDGEETAEPSIRAALLGKGKPPQTPLIDNRSSEVEIRLCGISQTVGKTTRGGTITTTRDAGRLKRLAEVWAAVFSNASATALLPVCPSLTLPSRTGETTDEEALP